MLSRGFHRLRVGLVWIALASLAGGCARDGEEVVIVSPWPEQRRSALAQEFRRWADANPGTAIGPVRVRWIPLAPGDDVTRVVRRRVAPDVVLGVGATELRRLAEEGRLLPIERQGHPLWCVTGREPIGLATRSEVRPDTVALDDFRHDPVALEWARGELATDSWAEGYARLVRWAGDARPIGRTPGAAQAAFTRGDGVRRVLWVEGRDRMPSETTVDPAGARGKPLAWVEGVALVRDGRNPALAQELVRFLAGRGEAESPAPGKGGLDAADDPEALALLADLLGATLVDAQDELAAAWAKLAAVARPERAGRWMTEAPPWPPASVEKLLKKGEEGAVLLETLTTQVAPDADVRNWLLRSWLAPARRVDGRLLAELAGAEGGRLVREPRFRMWLRSEWTTWARQRYRRVARLAGGAVP
jgi:hypothetical protein